MDRREWLLLFMAAPGGAFALDQIRIMKGIFLLIQEGRQDLRGYSFKPYDYGPFDHRVYQDLEALESEGSIVWSADSNTNRRTYRATANGRVRAEKLAAALDGEVVQAITEAKNRVTSMRLLPLLTYIYDKYPEYAVRSVIKR